METKNSIETEMVSSNVPLIDFSDLISKSQKRTANPIVQILNVDNDGGDKNALVEFFFRVNGDHRNDISDFELYKLVKRCWKSNPTYFLRLLFHLRDFRTGKGKGEINLFFRSFCFLIELLGEKEIDSLLDQTLKFFPIYGHFKDILSLLDWFSKMNGSAKKFKILKHCIARFFADELYIDQKAEATGDKEGAVSLIAKYAPSENMSYDRKYNLVPLICKYLGVNKQEYRQIFIAPLREYLKMKEAEKSPEALEREKAERDEKKKQPQDLVLPYFKNGMVAEVGDFNFNVEMDWNCFACDRRIDLLKDETERGKFWERLMVVPDTSFSMNSSSDNHLNYRVATSIAILASELYTGGPLSDRWMSFGQNPTVNRFSSLNICDKMKDFAKTRSFGEPLNLNALLENLLSYSVENNVPDGMMPLNILIISDLRFQNVLFDFGCEKDELRRQNIDERFHAAGYSRVPRLIYWNLNSFNLEYPSLAESFFLNMNKPIHVWNAPANARWFIQALLSCDNYSHEFSLMFSAMSYLSDISYEEEEKETSESSFSSESSCEFCSSVRNTNLIAEEDSSSWSDSSLDSTEDSSD